MTFCKVEIKGMDQVQRQLRALPAEMRDKVLAPAMNKTIAKGKSEMSRRIRAEFAIPASEVNPLLSVSKASAKTDRMVATISAFPRRRGHRSRNVMLFNARQVRGRKTKRVRVLVAPGQWRMVDVPIGGGVAVTIRKGGGRKLITGAFVGNKGRTVFVRTSAARNSMRGVETIDVPQMFNTRRVNSAVLKVIREELPVEVARAIRFITGRPG